MENKPTDIKSRIYELVGAASMCWSENPKGIFDDKNATKIAEELCSLIQPAQQFQTASHLPEGGEIAFIPCDENDERCVGGFTSSDGQSLCYVREIYLSTYQPNQPCKGMVGEEELMEMLNDKRIISVCGVDEGIWHISRKETARYLLEKYNITKADPTPVNNAVEASKGIADGLFTQSQKDYVNSVKDEDLRSHLLHQVRLRDNIEADRNAFEKLAGECTPEVETTPSIRSKEEILEDESLMLSIETGLHWYKHLMVSERKVLNMILKAMEEYAAQFHPKPPTENDAVEFAEWKDKHFKTSYLHDGGIYVLREYHDVKVIAGVLYGKHYSIPALYTLFKQHKQG